jgi:AraC family ethanolamine operon transcriptional activator
MNILSLAPSAALKTFRYDDLDQFRQVFRCVDVRYTPTIHQIAAEQAILHLPGCDIYLLKTFPRLIDAELANNCTMVGFTMDDDFHIRFNGWDKDRPAMTMGHGGAGYKIVETTASRIVSIVFEPAISGRDWPDIGSGYTVFAISPQAQQALRQVAFNAFRFASDKPDAFATPGAAEGIKESILATIDAVFAERDPDVPRVIATSARYFDIVHQIETVLSQNIGSPVYSDQLAQSLGISVRTMHNAMQQYRGVSLHRYLRLKRLWLVRQQLLAGERTVKACAIANGFWHLGEFSTIYHSHFGEPPSQTLARAR